MKPWICLAIFLLLPLAACGHKGDLKRPAEVKAAEEKSERKAAERAQ